MQIAISGSTGFIGSHLSVYLNQSGHQIIPLKRDIFQEGMLPRLMETINGCDIVINLAGAPINHRWSKKYKKILYDSRMIPTQMLVTAMNSVKQPPQLFISTSAVGYYPSEGCYDEYSKQHGSGFLAELCQHWEEEAYKIPPSVRLVINRFGVVLSPDGGALKPYLCMSKMKVSTILGNGTQAFSWIALQDLLRAISFIIEKPSLQGIFNFVAPQVVSNTEFTNAIARHYHTSLTLKVPQTLLHLLYGEASGFLTNNSCIRPTRLSESGFDFQYKNLNQFLESLK